MTKQEIFDKVWAGARTQNFKQSFTLRPNSSGSLYESCVYLSPEGLRCNAGHLIPDFHDALEFDGSWDMTIKEYPDLDVGHTRFVIELQEAHDNCNKPVIHKTALKRIAEVHQLKLPG